jgi:hypothetical protein
MPDIHIDSCDGGYRPTAMGTIGGRPFFFRMMGGGWSFGVAREDVGSVWWHSPDEELAFIASGGDGVTAFNEESIPYLLDGLEQYLVELGVPPEERRQVRDTAEQRAKRLFAREDTGDGS